MNAKSPSTLKFILENDVQINPFWRCCDKLIGRLLTWGERINSSFLPKDNRGKGNSELMSSLEAGIQEGNHPEREQNW